MLLLLCSIMLAQTHAELRADGALDINVFEADASSNSANSTNGTQTTNETHAPSAMPSMQPTAMPSVPLVCYETVEVNVTDMDGHSNMTNMTNITGMINITETVTINRTVPCTPEPSLRPSESPISISVGFRSSTFKGLMTELRRNMTGVDSGETGDIFPTQAFIDITTAYIIRFYETSDIVRDVVKITNVLIQVTRVETGIISVQSSSDAAAMQNFMSFTVLWDVILTYFGDLTKLESQGIVSEEAFVKLPFATEEDLAVYLEMLTNSTEFGDSFVGISPALVGATFAPSASPSQNPTMQSGASSRGGSGRHWSYNALFTTDAVILGTILLNMAYTALS